VNGLFYVVRAGCAWRYLPREYGAWSTVYPYFRQFCRDGTWERVQAQLRELARKRAGRESTPSAAIIDSQSIRTHQGGPRGFDEGKKIWGASGISWLGRARRLSRDDERLPASSEALLYLTSIRLLLARLA
jgi:transposase